MDSSELEWHDGEKKELLKTPVYTVFSKHSTAPDFQKEGDFIVSEAPDWVIVIPEDRDDFLMVRQWRHGEGKISTEFPGGVVDKGESAEEAAVRELREETGARCGTLIKLGEMNPNPALFSNHFFVFLAKNLVFTGIQELDKDEFVHYMRIPKKEVIQNMGKGEYLHGLMASALALFMINLSNEKENKKK